MTTGADGLGHPRLLIERGASALEVDRVAQEFSRIGFPVDVEAGFEVKSVPVEPFAGHLLEASALAFVTAFSALAGRDAYRGARRAAGLAMAVFLRRLSGTREVPRRQPIGLWVRSTNRSPDLHLLADLPDEAYVQLFEIDFEVVDGTSVGWDPETRRWVVLRDRYYDPPLLPPENDGRRP